MNETSQNQSSKKLRVLTVALIFSGVLNIGLIATCLFTGGEESKAHPFAHPVVQERGSTETTMDRYFTQLKPLSFSGLVSCLTNKDPVSEGYLKRDLALTALVAFHHFHIEKALSGVPLQKREIVLSDGTRGDLFPGLANNHFDAIIRFAYEEKWPLTTEGLFKLLKKGPNDKSLCQAFSMTPEFRSLEMLFQKTKQPVEILLKLVSEGSWDILGKFSNEQTELLDLSVERRRSLLLGYLKMGSKTAAQILLNTETPFILKKLDDQGTVELLSLLTEKSSAAELLCLELLRSPRSDAVWEAAVKNLYAYAGHETPTPFNLKAVMSQFIPSSIPPKEEKKIERIKEGRQHVVKEGDTFWKIARLYNVNVDELVQANGVDKNSLRPGMTLNIP